MVEVLVRVQLCSGEGDKVRCGWETQWVPLAVPIPPGWWGRETLQVWNPVVGCCLWPRWAEGIREQTGDIVLKSGFFWVRQETEADAKTEDIQEVWGGCEGKGEADGEAGRVSDCTGSDACRGGAAEVGGIVAHAILTEFVLSRPVQSPQTRTTHHGASHNSRVRGACHGGLEEGARV